MSNDTLHTVGRAIVDTDDLPTLRAAGLDALAEAWRITGECADFREALEVKRDLTALEQKTLVLAVLNAAGVRLGEGAEPTHGAAVQAVTDLRVERDALAARVAELEARAVPAMEVEFHAMGLTLYQRADGLRAVSRPGTHNLWRPHIGSLTLDTLPDGTPLYDGDEIRWSGTAVASVRKLPAKAAP